MRRFAAVALAAFALHAPLVAHRNLTDCGGSSRMATVESLVERGTFAIDGGTFAYTCDVMTRNGRLYSDKPPVLSVAAAGVYALLNRAFGLSFAPGANPYANKLHDHTYALMTVLVVVVAQALLAATFDAAAGELGVAGARRLLATASVSLATLLFPLARLFNSHTVAAALVLAGARWLFAAVPARPLAAGVVLGLAATVDLPLGLVALALAGVLGGRRLALAAGALPPLLVHAALNVWIVGDLVPFQMHRELYTTATGHTGDSATGFAQAAGLGLYAARNLGGALGVFALTPLLLAALPLAVAAAAGMRGLDPRRRRLAVFASSLFLAALALYVVVWPEAVGCSYGMRHVVPAVPPLLLAALAGLAARPSPAAWRAGAALALLSAILAGLGCLAPTTCAGFVTDGRAYVPAGVAGAAIERLRGLASRDTP